MCLECSFDFLNTFDAEKSAYYEANTTADVHEKFDFDDSLPKDVGSLKTIFRMFHTLMLKELEEKGRCEHTECLRF